MIKNPDIRAQSVKVSVAKDGTVTKTLVIETNLQPDDPGINKLANDAVTYMKEHNDIDRADIGCIVTAG